MRLKKPTEDKLHFFLEKGQIIKDGDEVWSSNRGGGSWWPIMGHYFGKRFGFGVFATDGLSFVRRKIAMGKGDGKHP